MALDLASYLAAGGETPRLWINFNDYTKKLLLGRPWRANGGSPLR